MVKYHLHIVKIIKIINVLLSVKLDIIDKSVAWFSFEDVKLGQGRENVKQKFKDEPLLAKEIEEKIKAAMGVNNIMIMGESEMNEVDE
jgi:recombination protein RecA